MEMPAWVPDEEIIKNSNLTAVMKDRKLSSFEALYNWSVIQSGEFWDYTVRKLGIKFSKNYSQILDVRAGPHHPQWMVNAKLNISESCFQATPDAIAIVFQNECGKFGKWTYADLERLSNQVANSLVSSGYKVGDRFGIAMPMTVESVAIYLGIVKMGGAVVSIADSFAPDEIQTRIRISHAKCVFTQDVILRGGKSLPMYEKVKAAGAEKIVVLPQEGQLSWTLRSQDLSWDRFLSSKENFAAIACNPSDVTNVLFSSGTTGDPKAIPWSHTTPIKCAADGFYHHDIHPGEVIAWPTNLGWMMGPWLIYATLINKATIALYYGAPTGREFGEFVQNVKVNMLGLVPSLVKTWRATECMKGLDWSSLKLCSSTGECSNADDYFWMMSIAGNKPVIEYCGGTEIGGGYLTSTVLQPSYPATFSTPALGSRFIILDEDNRPTKNGELFLVPPAMGLSLELLNKDHDEVYYADTPHGPNGEILRRHGDQVEELPNGYYRALGRADDTMNLGGIKVSSAEIERTLNTVDGVTETAAIAVNPPGGGPSLLVVFAVLQSSGPLAPECVSDLKAHLQKAIRDKLNPLFKIHDVVVVDSLPRTASNKIMRRVLRGNYKLV